MVAITTGGALQTPLLLFVGDLLGSKVAGQGWRTDAACRGQDPTGWYPACGGAR